MCMKQNVCWVCERFGCCFGLITRLLNCDYFRGFSCIMEWNEVLKLGNRQKHAGYGIRLCVGTEAVF